MAYVETIIASGQKYTDDEWQACLSSIYDENDEIAEEEKETYDALEWKRISEIIENPKMIVDGIHPNDIK